LGKRGENVGKKYGKRRETVEKTWENAGKHEKNMGNYGNTSHICCFLNRQKMEKYENHQRYGV